MIKSLTINFETNDLAQEFAMMWGRATLTGNCQSAVKTDGSRDVTVYDICNDRADFISSYFSQPKEKAITLANEEMLKELGL